MKKWFTFLISALLLVGLLGASPQRAQAVQEVVDTTAPTQTINMNNHDHFAFGEIINSYLFENDDHTLTRVEYTGDAVVAEVYSRDFQFIRGKRLPVELPIFGGFYAGENYNFLIFGQENPEELDTAEVVRIVRYSKDWVRMDSASLYGIDTQVPFRSTSLRCTEYNGYLYIRTARKRYDSHQTNTMFTVRISDMAVHFNRDVGYVSHSFNQFIANEGSTLITVDLGDAYPRAVVLYRYEDPLGDNLYYDSRAESVNVLPIMGTLGDNSTGVSMGGLEISGSCYIVAGNSVIQDENYNDLGPRNIFVTATRKDQFTSEGTTFRFLTSYTDEDNVDVSPPHLVKISDDLLMITWTEDPPSPDRDHIKYAFLDGQGNLIGSIYESNNALSDCKPIVVDGKVIWYVTSVSDPVFFVIDPENPENLPHQHLFSYGVTDYATYYSPGELYSECTLCGQTGETVRIPSIKEKPDEYDLTGTTKPPTCLEGGYVEPFWSGLPFYGHTFCYSSNVWHPALGHDNQTVTVAATCTQPGSVTTTCARCGESSCETIEELGHSYQSVTVEPDCYNTGSVTHTCTTCGDSYSQELPMTPHDCQQYRVHKEPSAMMAGRLEGYCTACEQTIYVAIPALNMGNYRYEIRQLPTCTDEGYAVYIWETPEYGCFEFTKLFAPVDHNYETETTSATCTEGGFVTHKCTGCGDSYITDETAPLGHSFEDGICTTCGAADPDYVNPVTPPTITLKYPTVSFEDVIVMNIYYTAENLQDVTEMGLITYSQSVEAPSPETAEHIIPGYTLDGGFYFSSTSGIAPKDIGDTIHFAVYYKLTDGTWGTTDLASYSPKTYALNVLKDTATTMKMKTLVVAMLNYGAAAQQYFGYKTDSLMNASLTAEQKSLAEAYRADMIADVHQSSGSKLGEMVKNGGYVRRYPTISFEGAFCINYYFIPSATPVGDVTMYIWNMEDYNAVSSLSKSNATKAVEMTLAESGEYTAVIDGIAAKDLDKAVYVSFCYSDGTTDYCDGVTGYTIGMYCKTQAAGTGTMANLASACAVYGYYAKNLFTASA